MKITNHKLCQFIVKKFIKENINWAKEIKIAQKLLKLYKGYKFWNNLKDIKIPSLAWFLTEDGKKFINTQLKINNLILAPKEKYIILNHKIDQDKKICKKPKTLIEFIQYGKKT